LTAMTVAGRALSWVRRSLPPHTPEPAVFFATEHLLDQLDEFPPNSTSVGEALLAEFGLNLLSHLGWALELSRCIRCGRPCPQGVPALLDPRRGGLICRNCGGGPYRISATLRNIMLEASRGTLAALSGGDASTVLDIVEDTLAHHPGVKDG
jgi:DNA repair protein RecO (recombination protein O)